MKAKIELECTPEEARAFLGLPDVTELNEQMVAEVKKRVAATAPEELMKTWMSFGGQAQDQFFKLMSAAAGGSFTGGSKAGS